MIASVYQRRIRTDATRSSASTGRQYAPAYRWGYVEGEPRWIRTAHVELAASGHTDGSAT
jgi:hypothetical protein